MDMTGTLSRMALHWIFLLLLFFHIDARCRFPREWKGRWFQSGLGEVNIKANAITEKGVCMATKDDYYLVENRHDGCFQCLLMIKRHKNLIQKRKKYRLPMEVHHAEETLQNVCAQIRVEAILYTLVKEPGEQIRCPFQDAYYFNYDDNTFGFCDKPISYAQPCAGEAKFKFHFKHCRTHSLLNGQDQDFECLATWKDGSDTYLYGQFSSASIRTKDDSYRCFIYQAYGNDVYMAMSADATCRGLRSAKDGPIKMELTKDLFGWPQPACNFPECFTEHNWRDLSGRTIYSPVHRGDVIEVFQQRRPDTRAHMQSQLRCLEMVSRNDTAGTFTAISFTSHGCTSKHQCLHVVTRVGKVVELHSGRLVDYEDTQRCQREADTTQDMTTLIPQALPEVPCPHPGKYTVETTDPGCKGDVTVGCGNQSLINFNAGCIAQTGVALECLLSWPERGDTTFILARRPNQPVVNCFSFREGEKVIEFSRDRHCNRGVTNILGDSTSITMTSSKETCDVPGDVSIDTTMTERDEPDAEDEDGYHVQSGLNNHMGKDTVGPSSSSTSIAPPLIVILLCQLTMSSLCWR